MPGVAGLDLGSRCAAVPRPAPRPTRPGRRGFGLHTSIGPSTAGGVGRADVRHGISILVVVCTACFTGAELATEASSWAPATANPAQLAAGPATGMPRTGGRLSCPGAVPRRRRRLGLQQLRPAGAAAWPGRSGQRSRTAGLLRSSCRAGFLLFAPCCTGSRPGLGRYPAAALGPAGLGLPAGSAPSIAAQAGLADQVPPSCGRADRAAANILLQDGRGRRGLATGLSGAHRRHGRADRRGRCSASGLGLRRAGWLQPGSHGGARALWRPMRASPPRVRARLGRYLVGLGGAGRTCTGRRAARHHRRLDAGRGPSSARSRCPSPSAWPPSC